MRASAAARGAVRSAHVVKADHADACLAVALAHDDFVGARLALRVLLDLDGTEVGAAHVHETAAGTALEAEMADVAAAVAAADACEEREAAAALVARMQRPQVRRAFVRRQMPTIRELDDESIVEGASPSFVVVLSHRLSLYVVTTHTHCAGLPLNSGCGGTVPVENSEHAVCTLLPPTAISCWLS